VVPLPQAPKAPPWPRQSRSAAPWPACGLHAMRAFRPGEAPGSPSRVPPTPPARPPPWPLSPCCLAWVGFRPHAPQPALAGAYRHAGGHPYPRAAGHRWDTARDGSPHAGHPAWGSSARDGTRRAVARGYVVAPAPATGSVSVKVVPAPTVLCTATCPPCAAITSCTI